MTGVVESWKCLPDLPDADGVGGSFVGVSGGWLLVAGGSRVVGDRWRVPVKTWSDTIWGLENPSAEWQMLGKLPRSCGHGVALSIDDGLLCIGGAGPGEFFQDALRVSWRDNKLHFEDLPSLPRPCAYACGTVVGRSIYLAGGIESVSDEEASRQFLALDLDVPTLAWRELESCPSEGRFLSVAATCGGEFLLFGGVNHPQKRRYLLDSYAFLPGRGWRRLADLPRAAAAAPSPAPGLRVIGGDDGRHVDFYPPEAHPGFCRDILEYLPDDDRWMTVGLAPVSRVTVSTTFWHGQVVIAGGEVRPRVRSAEVWMMP